MDNAMAQTIGFAGLILAMLSFQKKERNGILLFQIMASLAYFVHFLLLGAVTGSIMNLLGATRNYIFANREKGWAGKPFWLYLFIAVYAVVTALTWKGPYSLLPMAGMIVGTVSFWIKDPKVTRLVFLLSPPCWFTYNLIAGSIPGMATEIFTVTSILVGIVRFDLRKRPKPNGS
jgi:hypothetical protein